MDIVHNDQGEASEKVSPVEIQGDEAGGINSTLATVAVVAVGAALFEVALLPGLALGVVAVAAPSYLPKLARTFSPAFKSAVRGTFSFAKKSREAFAGVHEHVNDLVAEARTEAAGPRVPTPV